MDTPRLYESWDTAGIDVTGMRPDAFGQSRAICPHCTPNRKPQHQREKDLSVNLDKKTFMCQHCGFAGRIADHPERINRDAGATPISQRGKAYTAPRPLPKDPYLTPDTSLSLWAQERGLSMDTIQRFQLHTSVLKAPQDGLQHKVINFPYFVHGRHVNTKHRTISNDPRHFWMEPGAEQPFFNIDAIDPTQPLIIVEGETDCLSIHECGLPNVVSVPGGAPQAVGQNFTTKFSFFETATELISQVPSVIIATDGDGPGQVLQAELARRVGALKCRRVIWPNDTLKDANDVLLAYGPAYLKTLIENAPVYPVAGLYTGEDLVQDLRHAYLHGWDPGVKTGLDAFDRICRFVPGYISIITGHSGSGKSTVLDNLLVGLAKTSDWPIAMYSPEQMPLARHQSQIIEIYTGKKFAVGPTHTHMTIDEMEAANDWLSHYFSFINPENRRDLDSILQHIRMEVMRRGIKGFVIDPWNCIADEKPSHLAQTDWINKALFTIKMFAQETGTHGFIVAHPTKLKSAKQGEPEPRPTLTDISGSVNFRNQADYGIVVHRDQGSSFAKDIVEISIAKIRMQETGEAGGSAEFRYNRLNARIEAL